LPVTPPLSVLMCVYNGAAHLRAAVDSVLAQSFGDFRFVIVDDGSTDRSAEILRSYRDPRLVLQRNEQNLGLTQSLNLGLELCDTELVARMDADDVCLPKRLEHQLALLARRPDVGVCGTRIRVVDERGVHRPRGPTEPRPIAVELLFGNCVAHPSVMLRRKLLTDHGIRYDESLRRSQDYALWTRLVRLTRFAVLPERLLVYRQHASSVSRSEADTQRAARAQIGLRYLTDSGLDPDPRLLELHGAYMRRELDALRSAEAFGLWSRALLALPARAPHLDADTLLRSLSLRVAEVFRWPSPARRAVAHELLAAARDAAGSRSQLSSRLSARLIASYLPGPAWGYLRFG
jgi:hypothetical protein